MDWPEFQDIVKDALVNLYDFAYLRSHPLLDRLIPDASLPTTARVNALRALITQTIEYLAPDERVPRTAKEWRPYLTLRYTYLDFLSPEQVQAELGLGERQVMRERVRGIEAVAQMLWERSQETAAPAQAGSEAPLNQATSVDHELVDLGLERELLLAADLVDDAIKSVQPLAETLNVALQINLTDQGPMLVDRTLLRQSLIAALGIAIHNADDGVVDLDVHADNQALAILINWHDGQKAEFDRAWTSLQSLVTAQMGACSWQRSDERVAMQIRIPTGSPATILAIDDNESSLRLLERLLTSAGYQVQTASSGQDGLRVAAAEAPALILLDVMMRGMDGWEVLLKLKAMPETRHIPVIISSVLPEPDLALSLGASAFAQKPLRRLELTAAIRDCLAANRNSA